MPTNQANQSSLAETALVTAICFGWFSLSSLASAFSGFPTGKTFNDSSLWSMLIIECIQGGVALLYLRHRGHSIFDLLPTPSLKGCGLGLALYLASSFFAILVSSVFTSYRYTDQPIAQMVEQSRPSLVALVALSMVNGLYEETFLAGYLLERLRAYGAHIALGLTTLLRLLYHLYQGPIGAVSVTAYGIVVMLFYWRFRLLWPIVFAHTLADITAFVR